MRLRNFHNRCSMFVRWHVYSIRMFVGRSIPSVLCVTLCWNGCAACTSILATEFFSCSGLKRAMNEAAAATRWWTRRLFSIFLSCSTDPFYFSHSVLKPQSATATTFTSQRPTTAAAGLNLHFKLLFVSINSVSAFPVIWVNTAFACMRVK